jgi:hypothetical protein
VSTYGQGSGRTRDGLADFMGISRIHQDKHWLSEVSGGATRGYIEGRTVTRVSGWAEGAARAT